VRKACVVFWRLWQLLLLLLKVRLLLMLETWHLATECLPLRGMRRKVAMLTMRRTRIGIVVKKGRRPRRGCWMHGVAGLHTNRTRNLPGRQCRSTTGDLHRVPVTSTPNQFANDFGAPTSRLEKSIRFPSTRSKIRERNRLHTISSCV
jgi:hypothetical protein